MKFSSLADVMHQGELHTASPQESVRTACIKMSAANVGALPVVDDDGLLIGMISERDVIKRSVIVYRPSEETTVSQIMTRRPKWLAPDATGSEALDMMLAGHFRHLPICDEGELVGIVSMRDVTMQE